MRLSELQEAGELTRRQFLSKSISGIAAIYAGCGLNPDTIKIIATTAAKGEPIYFKMAAQMFSYGGETAAAQFKEVMTSYNLMRKLVGKDVEIDCKHRDNDPAKTHKITPHPDSQLAEPMHQPFEQRLRQALGIN